MAITVKKITLWRKEIENAPGTLAATLQPISDSGADLQIVMGYRYPGHEKAVVEVCPVTGKKSARAAEGVGLAASGIATLLVEGDNKPGLGAKVSQAVAEAGINMSFLVAQVIGRKFSAVIGFENDEAAKKAAALIKKVGTVRKK